MKSTPLDNRQPTRLDNKRCAYCFAEFVRADEPQKEHVIAKNFVPRGSHEQHWNLHLNACHACNQAKSALERDISAITMVGTMADGLDHDLKLSEEAIRKGKTPSVRTGRPVSQSSELFEIGGKFGDATLTFTLQSPPQADDQRMFRLACYQMQGFHFFLTYDHTKRHGYGWKGSFAPLDVVRRSDWGNPLIVSFSELVAAWPLRLTAYTASGYYRALIKKHPGFAMWSWALEWNKNFRVFGFYGDNDSLEKMKGPLAPAFEAMQMQDISENRRYRMEVPSSGNSDLFFEVRGDGEVEG